MAITQGKFIPPELTDDDLNNSEPQEVEVPSDTEEHEDGSVTVSFGDDEDKELKDAPFEANLVDYLSDTELGHLENKLLELFEADDTSRAEWVRAYIEGLDLLGIKMEDRTKPWPGACGVYHPVLAEAVVRFEAQAIMELFPPQGPAKTKIMGTETPDLMATADRVKEELNYILIEDMTDYRDETESLLFRLPLAGSAFRKVYYDTVHKRPSAKFVPAEDFVVAYGESDLRSAGRYTYIDRISVNELKRRKASGFYADVELGEPTPTFDDVEKKEGELTGVKQVSEGDDRYVILEMHVDLDIDELGIDDANDDEVALPYIVHLEKESGKILAVYRNWDQGDELKQKKCYFIHYKYLPGLGFYGLGLIHLIGGLAKSSTSILRQLVDAGTLSNLPGGLKSRGLRIKGDDSPIRPGEFRDVDVSSGDIQKNITFLPYKEPSAVLYQLLGNIVDEARRVGSIADLEVGDMNQEAPVGTTLALMERALKVMSAVQARCHASLQQELRLIAACVKNFMGPHYKWDTDNQFNRTQDFASVDIIPVSDPGATTMSQRVVQYQAVIQLASQNPQIYDMRKLNLDMLNVLGIKDATSLVPDPTNIPPMDPVSENQNIIKGSPVKAYDYQDHSAHMAVHMAMAQDPQIKAMIGQSPNAGVVEQAMASHMADHLAFAYRQQIEKQLGTSLPPQGMPLPQDVETQVSQLVAKAAPQLLQQNQDAAAQQQAQQQAQDPLIQMQQQELAIKQSELALKAQIENAKLELDGMKAALKDATERLRIETQAKIEGTKIGVEAGKKRAELHTNAKTQIATTAISTAGNLAAEQMRGDVAKHLQEHAPKPVKSSPSQ